jgi:N-methylhydantoinase A/oxoprolinase/acetone carboxylase beta subunit
MVAWDGSKSRCEHAHFRERMTADELASHVAALKLPQPFEVVLAYGDGLLIAPFLEKLQRHGAPTAESVAAKWVRELADIESRLQAIGMQRLSVVQSCGGRVWSSLAAKAPMRACESVTAVGVVAAAHLARLGNLSHFVSFQPRDPAVVLGVGDRQPRLIYHREDARLPINEPGVAHTLVSAIGARAVSLVEAPLVRLADAGRQPLRDSWLVAFGDAPASWACQVAEDLDMPGVLLPPEPETFAAWGTLWADVVAYADHWFSPAVDAATFDMADLRDHFGRLMDSVAEAIFREGYDLDNADVERLLDGRIVLTTGRIKRYGLQVTCPAEWLSDREWLLRDFHKAHEQQTGARFEGLPVEILGLRVRATVPLFKPPMPEPSEEPPPIEGLPAGWHGAVEQFGIRRLTRH